MGSSIPVRVQCTAVSQPPHAVEHPFLASSLSTTLSTPSIGPRIMHSYASLSLTPLLFSSRSFYEYSHCRLRGISLFRGTVLAASCLSLSCVASPRLVLPCLALSLVVFCCLTLSLVALCCFYLILFCLALPFLV